MSVEMFDGSLLAADLMMPTFHNTMAYGSGVDGLIDPDKFQPFGK